MSIYLLKMVPSNDPLPFKLFLGYMDYPTDTNFVAMTEMPHQGTTQGDKSLCLGHVLFLMLKPFKEIFDALLEYLCGCVFYRGKIHLGTRT